MNKFLFSFQKRRVKQLTLAIIIALSCAVSIYFGYNNYSFYDHPIAQVTEATLVETTGTIDQHGNNDRLFRQDIIAQLKNGKEKGQTIYLTNEYTLSGAYDHQYKIGDELFVWIDKNAKGSTQLTGAIQNVKRDKYLIPLLWIFIFVLLIIGKKQGLFSFISLAINAILLSIALDIYVKHSNISLLIICGITVVLFTIISLLLVNGFNEKTYAAIIATLLGTFSSLTISYIVLWITSENGIRYEAMDFCHYNVVLSL